MDNQHTKRSNLIASLILAIVCVGGLLYFWRNPSVLALVFFPLLAMCATALVRCLLTAFVFCLHPEKWLAKTFRRTLRFTLIMPLWTLFTGLFLLLPGESLAFLDETLTEAVIILGIAIALTIVPMAFLVCGIVSIGCGVSHIKHTPATETHLYREGPLVLACLLLIGEIAYALWFFFYALMPR
ncbi:MAG: hypothetical protein RRY96_07445 [Ruthenibacterium sp.]